MILRVTPSPRPVLRLSGDTSPEPATPSRPLVLRFTGAGSPGRDGEDGKDGANGADGVGFNNYDPGDLTLDFNNALL